MTYTEPMLDSDLPARRIAFLGALEPRRDRKRSISVRRLLERTAAHQGSPHTSAQRLAVETTMAALSPRERACVILRYCEDRTTAEIAAALGITDDAVKKHLGTAVRRLSGVLGPLPGRQIEPITGSQGRSAT
jgi:RNA polymerase sigma factor (sigma-70 family)